MSLVGWRNKFKESGKHGWWIILIVFAVVLTSYFGLGGGGGPQPSSDQQAEEFRAQQEQILATVGEQKITRGEVDQTLEQFSQGQNITPLQKHQMALMLLPMLQDQAIKVQAAEDQKIRVSSSEVKAAIDERMAEQAKAIGLDAVTDKQQKALLRAQIRSQFDENQIRRDLMVQKLEDSLRKKVTLNTPGLKESDIEVSARHILVMYKGAPAFKNMPNAPKATRTQAEAKARAEKLLADAKKNPAEFDKLAKANTDEDAGKESGGELGYFTKDRMVKPFADAAFKAKPGDIIGPVLTDFGYHVIKVEDRRVAQARSQQEVQKFLDEQKKKVKPVIVASDLKALQAMDDYYKAKSGKDKKVIDEKRKAAITAYEKAAADRKSDPAVSYMLGQLYAESGSQQQALKAYQAASGMRPPMAEVHMALGDTYRKLKQTDKALEEYRVAGRLAGDNMNVHQQLFMAYNEMGQKDLAKQQMTRLTNLQQNMMQSMPQTIPGG